MLFNRGSRSNTVENVPAACGWLRPLYLAVLMVSHWFEIYDTAWGGVTLFIHFVYQLIAIQTHGRLEPIPACTGQRTEKHSGQVAGPTRRRTESDSFWWEVWSLQCTWFASFWAVGGKRKTWRKPTQITVTQTSWTFGKITNFLVWNG